MRKIKLLLACLVACVTAAAQPYIKLPSIISDGMVIQANDTVTIWGWCDPNTEVEIVTSWGETAMTKSDFSSAWKASVKTPSASFDPVSITIKTKRKASVVLKDILVGQVWLCSGQSNMYWSSANKIPVPENVLENPSVRLFSVPRKTSGNSMDDVDGVWEGCRDNASKYFSATGLFFGEKLARELNQPVGLINASWGGTPIEIWTPKDQLATDGKRMASWNRLSYSSYAGWDAGTAYNAMIAPITNCTIAGVIWYQGESNRNNAEMYAQDFSLMIDSWRDAFGRDLPFYFVQIAPKEYKGADDKGAIVREQQESVARKVPRTGMVNISDTVDDLANIHPKDKRTVGERLAAYALAEVYGKNVGKYKSPSFAGMEVKRNRIVASFDNAEGGLVCNGSSIEGLEIGDGTNFYPAQGMLQGQKMVAWSDQVKKPFALRYCFGLYKGNVTDVAGNPLLPFRSDRPQIEIAHATKNPLPVKSSAAVNVQTESVRTGGVAVSCAGAELRELRQGVLYYTNRKYTVSQVPESLAGLQMAAQRADGREPHTVTITALEQGTVMLLAKRSKLTTESLQGWKVNPKISVMISANSPDKPDSQVVLWTRSFSSGEEITITGMDFAGFTVVSSHIDLR